MFRRRPSTYLAIWNVCKDDDATMATGLFFVRLWSNPKRTPANELIHSHNSIRFSTLISISFLFQRAPQKEHEEEVSTHEVNFVQK